MKKSSLAVAALLTTLSAATIVPVAYADDSNSTQMGACKACKGMKCTGADTKSTDAKSTDGTDAKSTDGTDAKSTDGTDAKGSGSNCSGCSGS